jgi:hypothetical protein
MIMDQDQTFSKPSELVHQFRCTAPANLQKLAEVLAIVPISRAMIRLIQTNILHDRTPPLWAELALNSLLCPPEISIELVHWSQTRDFMPGVREELLKQIPVDRMHLLADEISEEIIAELPGEFQHCIFEDMRRYFSEPLSYFETFLLPNEVWRNEWLRSQMLPFTQVAEQVAQCCGGSLWKSGRSLPAAHDSGRPCGRQANSKTTALTHLTRNGDDAAMGLGDRPHNC